MLLSLTSSRVMDEFIFIFMTSRIRQINIPYASVSKIRLLVRPSKEIEIDTLLNLKGRSSRRAVSFSWALMAYKFVQHSEPF